MADWKDVTSYSRGDTERIPRVWEIAAPGLRICVTRHICAPGAWFLRCPDVGMDMFNLHSDDVDAAKAKALRLVADRLAKLADYAARLAASEKGG